MTKKLLININPAESRVALLEDGTLSEIYIEHQHKLGTVGNIYIGTVVRVLVAMQACFVDIGQACTAFLHIDDMQQNNQIQQLVPKHLANKKLIEYQVFEGQKILVQVIKEPISSKGARLTTKISLPSRYLVYLPFGSHIGVSQRIERSERERIKKSLIQLTDNIGLSGGLVARTTSENASHQKLEAEILYLLQLWKAVASRRASMSKKQRSALIYQELSLPMRAIRDLVGENTERVMVDDEMVFAQIQQFAKEFVPQVYPRLQLYTAKQSLFDSFQVEMALKNALNRRVDLTSGGYIVIDQTESMTTIDVNTGALVQGCSPEDMIYQTNLEATYIIARQLRLRNLGGIIIIDFIDMKNAKHRQAVLENLKQQFDKDDAKTHIHDFSALGLIEMTRQRTTESLQQQLCRPCRVCGGTGIVKSHQTICLEIFREIMRYARCYPTAKQFQIFANSDIIQQLQDKENAMLAELTLLIGRPIQLCVEPCYGHEQYHILYT